MKLNEVAQQKHQLTKHQIDWLNSAVNGTWQLNQQTGMVDVNGDVYFPQNSAQIPVKFGAVGGDFDCYGTNITSLQGAPSSVGGYFMCSSTNITSLQGAPSSVGGYFMCSSTKIASLQGAPSSVGGGFYCSHTPIARRVLQVLKYPQIKTVVVGEDNQLNDILNKYLAEPDRDILACQDELIDAGYAEIARL